MWVTCTQLCAECVLPCPVSRSAALLVEPTEQHYLYNIYRWNCFDALHDTETVLTTQDFVSRSVGVVQQWQTCQDWLYLWSSSFARCRSCSSCSSKAKNSSPASIFSFSDRIVAPVMMDFPELVVQLHCTLTNQQPVIVWKLGKNAALYTSSRRHFFFVMTLRLRNPTVSEDKIRFLVFLICSIRVASA